MIRDLDFTVGNTITIAVAIYKQNCKKFLKLSFMAHIWLLVPIYGWARYYAIAAWISRLSLNELSAQSHVINYKQYLRFSSLKLFLVSAFTTIFVTVIISYLLLIMLSLFIGIFAGMLDLIFGNDVINNFKIIIEQKEGIAYRSIIWSILFCFIFTSVGLYSRLFVAELNFSDQGKYKIFGLIKQSFYQTKNSKLKVFKITWISLLLSLGLYLPIYLLLSLLGFASYQLNFHTWQYFDQVFASLFLITLIVANVILMPFWQSVKAVAFFQLVDSKINWNLK